MKTMVVSRLSIDQRFAESAILAVCGVAIAGAVLWYSRLVQLFRPPVATLGLAIFIICVLAGFMLREKGRFARYYIFMAYSAGLISIWLLVFALQTSLVGDWRTFGNMCAIFTFFPVLLLMSRLGVSRAIALVYWICVAYTVVYVVAAFSVTTFGLFPDAPLKSVILVDPWRGRRLYPLSAVIAFALVYPLCMIRGGRNPWLYVPLAGLAVLAMGLANSRMLMLLCAVVAVFALLDLRRASALTGCAYVGGYFVVSLVSGMLPELMTGVLLSLEDPTLNLRIYSFDMAQKMFSEHPVFGLGLPGDATFHYMYTGFLYFPDDLGPLGVLGAYGVTGMIWVIMLLGMIVRSKRTLLARNEPELAAVAFAGFYVMLTTAGSPSIFQGDAGVIFGLVIAAGAFLRARGSAPGAVGAPLIAMPSVALSA